MPANVSGTVACDSLPRRTIARHISNSLGGLDLLLVTTQTSCAVNSNVTNNGETPHNETLRDSYFDYLDIQFKGASAANPADVASRLAGIRDDLVNHRPVLPKKP